MNKVINSFYIKIGFGLFFLINSFNSYAQDSALNKYGLQVISSYTIYLSTVRKDWRKEMVDLKQLVPGLVVDLRYAGNNNFMKTRLYPSLKTTFLRKPAAIALAAIQEDLKRKGLGLEIFDAYRPYSVTEKMWELIKDERYVADPKTGSGHNRGISVDLTIIDLQTKGPLNMGTEFDNFSDSAHHGFTGLPKEVLQNRLLLRNIMEKNGFKALGTEWWHYSFSSGAAYELLDIGLDELRIAPSQ
ncbi:MAG: M15 family metallopeptidase [Ferruginibacter sp.]